MIIVGYLVVSGPSPLTMGVNCEGQINAISMNKDSSMVVVAGRSGNRLVKEYKNCRKLISGSHFILAILITKLKCCQFKLTMIKEKNYC